MTKQEIAARLKKARIDAGMTQAEAAEKLGVSYQAVSNYERGTNRVDSATLSRLCEIYGVRPAEMLGGEDLPREAIPVMPASLIPVLGVIPAGTPLLAAENIEGYAPADVGAPEEHFFLRVKGTSMIGARIYDGDLVLIRRQSCADNGDIVACRVDGDEVTLKRFKRQGDMVFLLPENPEFEPRIVPIEEFETGDASILGVVVEVRYKP